MAVFGGPQARPTNGSRLSNVAPGRVGLQTHRMCPIDSAEMVGLKTHPTSWLIGVTLARMERRLALGRLVSRFPKLAAAGEREVLGLARFRGYTRFPVRVV